MEVDSGVNANKSDPSGSTSTPLVPTVISWGRLVSITPRLRLRCDLTNEEIVAGRSHECNVRLPQSELWISGKHFRLFRSNPQQAEEGQALLQDLSTHGTWLNGVLIGKGSTLTVTSGDKIGIRMPRQQGRLPRTHDTFCFALEIFTSEERKRQANCLIPNDHPLRLKYDILNTLGDGQFSVVYEGIVRATGVHVAIKVIKVIDIGSQPLVNLERELTILTRVRHPCIISLLDYYEDLQNNMRFIVLELADGGDLFDLIKAKGAMNDFNASRCFVHLLCALKQLHSLGVVHRDLKPENCLIVSNKETGNDVMKISDFGLATILGPYDMARTLCGTPQYVAPEILIRASDTSNTSGYGKSCDLWSLGAILFALISGGNAFDGTKKNMYDDIIHGKISRPLDTWKDSHPLATDLLKNLLVVDANKRFTVERALCHPWCVRALENMKEEGGEIGEMAKRELNSITPSVRDENSALIAPFQLPSTKLGNNNSRQTSDSELQFKRRKSDMEVSPMKQ